MATVSLIDKWFVSCFTVSANIMGNDLASTEKFSLLFSHFFQKISDIPLQRVCFIYHPNDLIWVKVIRVWIISDFSVLNYWFDFLCVWFDSQSITQRVIDYHRLFMRQQVINDEILNNQFDYLFILQLLMYH